MQMSRVIRRVLLGLALLGALGVLWALFFKPGFATAGEWGGVAGALAVITAVISAWNSQRSLEQQEDQLRPYPYPTIDVTSRPGVVQLRLKNFGATAAHDVRLEWAEEPTDTDGEPIGFQGGVSVLHPKESIVETIGGSPGTFGTFDEFEFRGAVRFEDPSGREYRHPFRCGGEKYRGTSLYHSDRQELLHKFKGIPKDLTKVQKELKKIRREIEQDG